MAAKIVDNFDDVRELRASGDSYFVYDPSGDLPEDRWLPFATIVTADRHDQASNLDRAGVYRLNVGLTKATYLARFGQPPTKRDGRGVLESPFEYTALDVVMPHPIYGAQYWVCVLNPGPATLAVVDELLADAYAFAVRKDRNQRARRRAGATSNEH